jgi:hypothetical protein
LIQEMGEMRDGWIVTSRILGSCPARRA